MRAAFFDIDGTLTSERTWKGLMDYFQQHRLRRGVHLAFMAAHYPLYFLRRMRLISESAFRSPWAAHLAWYVRGFTPEGAQPVWEWAAGYLSRYWRPDTRAILDDHRRSGDLVMLVSSGPLPLVERIAEILGAEHFVGTRFEVVNDRYTGRALPPVVIDEIKARAALDYLQEKGIQIDLRASYAYADSTPDVSLLEMVGHPVAVYPDAGLKAYAQQRDWAIFPEL